VDRLLVDDPLELNNLAGADRPEEVRLNDELTRHINDIEMTTINLEGPNPRV